MIIYDGDSPYLLAETVYKYNNLGKYVGVYILGPVVASLFGGFLASIF